MTAKPLGFAGDDYLSASTRHGWSKALRLAPDLYPGTGGKRFRAELVQRAFEFAGGRGDAPRAVIDSIELLHAGSLVVDDFEDNSKMRRGQPALHRVIGASRAVNAGNWMYFRALEIAGLAYDSLPRRAELLTRFIKTARQCHEGQAIDLAVQVDGIAPRQAWAAALGISRWKTGRLASLASWCGAHAAGGDSKTLRGAAAFGCRVGVCLQMKNDLEELAAFAEGSDRCDDLDNLRVTWPWAWAARDLTEGRFRSLQRRLGSSAGSVADLRALARDLVALTAGPGAAYINERLARAANYLQSSDAGANRTARLAEVAGRLRAENGTLVADPSR